MTQPQVSRDAKPKPAAEPAVGDAAAIPGDLFGYVPATPHQVPPHQLWASLEEAYAVSDELADDADVHRLPGYLGLAITLSLSLGLWAVIVKLVILR